MTGMDGLQMAHELFFTGLNPVKQVLNCVLETEEKLPDEFQTENVSD